MLEEAVQLTSASRPQLARHLDSLGIALVERFHEKGYATDLERAVQLHRIAVSLTDDADPDKPRLLSNFVIALQTRFDWLGISTDTDSAILTKQKAVDLTPDRHPWKSTHLSGLQMEAPTLHDVKGGNIKNSQLATGWENIINDIRNLPEFAQFLKPRTLGQLAPAAHEGPVVVLNVSYSRSDALVLVPDDSKEKHTSVVNIPLTGFSYETCEKLRENLASLLKSSGLRDGEETRKTGRLYSTGNAEDPFQQILRILWKNVARPVIDGLGYKVRHRNHA